MASAKAAAGGARRRQAQATGAPPAPFSSIFRLKRCAFHTYGLSFRGKTAVFPLTSGRAALYAASHLAFFKGKTFLDLQGGKIRQPGKTRPERIEHGQAVLPQIGFLGHDHDAVKKGVHSGAHFL